MYMKLFSIFQKTQNSAALTRQYFIVSSHKISEVSKRKLLHSTHTATLTLLCMKSFGVWAPFSLLLLYAGLQSQDMLLVQNDCSIWSHPFHSLPRKIGERQKEGKRWEYKTTLPASWENYIQIKKQQLELDMEQQTGSKSGKEYVKTVYCHPVNLIYMQSTSCEMPGWMKHKLESRLPEEISITSEMQMTPPLWQKVKN